MDADSTEENVESHCCVSLHVLIRLTDKDEMGHEEQNKGIVHQRLDCVYLHNGIERGKRWAARDEKKEWCDRSQKDDLRRLSGGPLLPTFS